MILVGSTIPAYKAADHPLESQAWLVNAEEMVKVTKDAGHDIKFFASLEIDGRGTALFQPIVDQLKSLNGSWWWFGFDMGDNEVTTSTRLPRICAGRNMIQDFALMHVGFTHILFLDSDLVVPPDSIPRLLSLKHPITGGNVPSYCLKGPKVVYTKDFDLRTRNIRAHWNTAGFLLVQREVFRHIRWGIDPDAGRTDDPQYQYMAKMLGFGETWVDHGLKGTHRPHTNGVLPAMEKRGHDRKYYR